jgi:hypothetical protein
LRRPAAAGRRSFCCEPMRALITPHDGE